MLKHIWLLIFISSCSYAATPDIASKPSSIVMEYRYWDLGASSKRDEYQRKLLELVLEKSKPHYGDYKIIRINERFTSARATREVSRGKIINIEASPYKPSSNSNALYASVDLITSKTSILKNLLGYRVLIVKKDRLGLFESITEDNLKKMTAGQAQDWSDVNIYRENNYKIDSSANFNTLIPMLAAGRVDYIPLSIIEAENVIKQFPKYQDQVAIVPNLFIYYSFPVHFNMSIYAPKLAERLEQGLDLAQQDGSFDALFNQYFLAEYTLAQNPQNRIFRLRNSHVSD